MKKAVILLLTLCGCEIWCLRLTEFTLKERSKRRNKQIFTTSAFNSILLKTVWQILSIAAIIVNALGCRRRNMNLAQGTE
jgi:hypothetical protein